ncbi:glutamine amidotransferase, class-I [Listeria floridensis FSL S10-1187]|uniref:Glutamine amidotransferase, class-I n=1 Tax=Listeria floridensis FSL S10-1187 TaxID=1265817 RepID=A0ABP3B2N3_9LIST|nr:gamma-glutamyl-gamma-aminobutyrate hydrolase family protein [Listeria floridensis]EUJ33435.1 glutamine amidotransferase, class-I [Listeria floridensis FSL S10-1187]
MKPIIGITGNELVKGADIFYGHRVTYTQQRYVDAIQKVGGLPLVIPVGDAEAAKQAIGLVDGLLMTGGQDITPQFYREEPLPEIGNYFPPRDHSEIALIEESMKLGKPILAVCRGMQLVNVALGGSLYQDGSYVKESGLLQHLQRADDQLPSHTVEIDPESILATVHSVEKRVNSLHHQYIKQVANQLEVTGRTKDGMVEAVEGKGTGNWLLGVQWHPELMYDKDPESEALFALFVEETKKTAGKDKR